MKRAAGSATVGLEAAPDIMMLTMAALMVAIVWLVAHASEATLPPVDLPESAAASLGASDRASVQVTLRPGEAGTEVWIDDERLDGGLAQLADALTERNAAGLTLRADERVPWRDALEAMTASASAGLPVSVAADGP